MYQIWLLKIRCRSSRIWNCTWLVEILGAVTKSVEKLPKMDASEITDKINMSRYDNPNTNNNNGVKNNSNGNQ